jgi:hypothetical protein
VCPHGNRPRQAGIVRLTTRGEFAVGGKRNAVSSFRWYPCSVGMATRCLGKRLRANGSDGHRGLGTGGLVGGGVALVAR